MPAYCEHLVFGTLLRGNGAWTLFERRRGSPEESKKAGLHRIPGEPGVLQPVWISALSQPSGVAVIGSSHPPGGTTVGDVSAGPQVCGS